MKQRCLNPRCRAYRNYGARGITVCAEWMEFEPFCQWALENGYAHGLDLDRADNDGNYSPENCRWVKRDVNLNNRRVTIMLTVNGETKPRTEWERALHLPPGIVKAWVVTRGTAYAEERLEEVVAVGYQERDFNRNHTMFPVRCIETGVIYQSGSEAFRQLKLKHNNVLVAAKRHGSAGGYHFELV